MTKEELYIIGVDFKVDKSNDKYKKLFKVNIPSWEDLNKYCGHPFKSGESFRQFVKRRQKKDGTLKEIEIVRDVAMEKKISDLELKEIKVKKESIKLQDLRASINKDIRILARKESLGELIKESVKDLKLLKFQTPEKLYGEDNEMILQISDCHFGSTVYNEFETYDENVFIERLAEYTMQILEIKKKEKINKCHICFSGDLVSGTIHENIIRNNQYGIVDQTKRFSEYASRFIEKLSNHFESIVIHFVTGNHSRNDIKQRSENKDRYEIFVLSFMQLRTANLPNVKFEESILSNTLAEFYVKGHYCTLSHGDYDNARVAPSKMLSLLDKKPKFIFLGHRHIFELLTIDRCKVITSGAFATHDEFCTNHRLVGEPSQTVTIIGERGLICAYDCRLK